MFIFTSRFPRILILLILLILLRLTRHALLSVFRETWKVAWILQLRWVAFTGRVPFWFSSSWVGQLRQPFTGFHNNKDIYTCTFTQYDYTCKEVYKVSQIIFRPAQTAAVVGRRNCSENSKHSKIPVGFVRPRQVLDPAWPLMLEDQNG